MLERAAEPWPEATARDNLVVSGTRVVVAADGATRGNIALSHDEAGNKERVVVVLLMGGEDNAVAHLAAGQRRVVAHHGVVESEAKLQMHMLAQQEADSDDAVLQRAAVTHHAVTEHDTAIHHRAVILARPNSDIAYCLSVLDCAVVPYPSVTALVGAQSVVGKLFQLLHKSLAATVASPHISVANRHPAERNNPAAAVLIHRLQFGRLVRIGKTGHLFDIEQHHIVTQAVVTEHLHIVNHRVIPHCGVGKIRMEDTLRQRKTVVRHSVFLDDTEVYLAIKSIVAQALHTERVGHANSRPVFCIVARSFQLFYLTRGKVSVAGIHSLKKDLQNVQHHLSNTVYH